MSSAEAELRKLAHTLDVDPAALEMIASLPGEDLRTLRQQVAEALFQADKLAFTRVAAISRSVPLPIVAKLSEAALPPLLAARTAELLEPARAADMVNRMTDRYLADVAAAMDASRAAAVVAAISPERVARVGRVLAARQEWVVMGGFVSEVSTAALAAAVAELDGEQLLHIGFVLDDPDRLEDISALLTDRQLDELLDAAVDVALWRELTDLLANLPDGQAERLAARFAIAGDDLRSGYRAAVDAGELHAAALARLEGP